MFFGKTSFTLKYLRGFVVQNAMQLIYILIVLQVCLVVVQVFYLTDEKVVLYFIVEPFG